MTGIERLKKSQQGKEAPHRRTQLDRMFACKPEPVPGQIGRRESRSAPTCPSRSPNFSFSSSSFYSGRQRSRRSRWPSPAPRSSAVSTAGCHGEQSGGCTSANEHSSTISKNCRMCRLSPVFSTVCTLLLCLNLLRTLPLLLHLTERSA